MGSKEVGLEVNAEKTKYMLILVTRVQDKIIYFKVASKSFGNMIDEVYIFGNDGNKSKFHS
jgi:hypothetical protein